MSDDSAVASPTVADTIMRTVELDVTVIDGDAIVVFCNLSTTAHGRCPAFGSVGKYRDRIARRVTDVPVVAHPLRREGSPLPLHGRVSAKPPQIHSMS